MFQKQCYSNTQITPGNRGGEQCLVDKQSSNGILTIPNATPLKAV